MRGRSDALAPIAAGPVALDPETWTCTVDGGEPFGLTRTEMALLHALMRHAGQVMPKDRLAAMLYAGDTRGRGLKIIDVYVCKLRAKLTRAGAPRVIVTDWGGGYRFLRQPDCVVRSFTPSTWQRIKAIADEMDRAVMIIPAILARQETTNWSDRESVEQFIANLAPAAPRAVRNLVAALVTSPRMTSDDLLVVADGYVEGALETAFGGESARPLATSLHALAKLLRERAPHHAQGGRP